MLVLDKQNIRKDLESIKAFFFFVLLTVEMQFINISMREPL